MKTYIRNFLENKYVETTLLMLILFNIICLCFETDSTIYNTYFKFFHYVEIISICIFTIEYILRVITIKKINDITKPLMLIDLMAVLPFYLPFLGLDFRLLRLFRLFRILRIFKLARYFDALRMMGSVIYKKRVELLSILGVLIFSIFLSSFFMFHLEHNAQPENLKNILDTFWWSLTTFTTIGYGDIYPVTYGGRLLSAIIVLLGIMLFALPTSILTAEFLNIFKKDND